MWNYCMFMVEKGLELVYERFFRSNYFVEIKVKICRVEN